MTKVVSLALACALVATVYGAALGQSAPRHWITGAGTNSTLAFGARATLGSVFVTNAGGGAPAYLKLYDTATAPTCGAGTPVWTVPSFASGTPAGGAALALIFASGVGFCVTGGVADLDTSPAPAGVVIDLGFSGR